MAKGIPSSMYFSTREFSVIDGIMSVPETPFMKIYKNRNSPGADYFISMPYTCKGEFPAIILFDPLAVEEKDLFNKEGINLPDLEKLRIRQPHNRINIPKHQKDRARLDKRVCLIGAGDHMEIWEPSVLRRFDEGKERYPSWMKKIFNECLIEYMQEWNCRVRK